MKISVVIQTYNSEQFLERVLNSVKEFDEIVVCDMYSTDRTIEIARKFDCKIVYHKKTDFCEPARNLPYTRLLMIGCWWSIRMKLFLRT